VGEQSALRLFPRGHPERCNVSQVLGTADGFFVADQLTFVDEGDLFLTEEIFNPPFPRLLEGDSLHRGQEVDPVRWIAELDKAARLREILDFEPQASEAEIFEARSNRSTFSRVGSTQRSMSFVCLGLA
jgi:hypothetical protein